MSKRYTAPLLFGICCLSIAYGDASGEISALAPSAIEPVEITSSAIPEPFFVQPVVEHTPAVAVIERPFTPFTGKIKGRKVRLRATADLEGRVVKELNRQDLLVIVGEKGDFYSVEPPAGSKAYVFRSFVLDGIVEGNRVNVRLEPSLDAPVIGHLNSGDHIKGTLSSLNNKWYEISPPPGTRFYVAKEYIDSIGGPEVKAQLDKRRSTAEQLLDAATLLTQAEMKKSFREMDIDRIKHNYQTVMNEFTEFPDLCDKAKEGFNVLQEEYTQRRISYLEEKAEGKISSEEAFSTDSSHITMNPTDRMKLWEPVEESLYLTWSTRNDDRSQDEFYDEQRQAGAVLIGIVEPYASPVKRKPGDYVLKDKDLTKAYLYSTHINLQEFVGKKVTVLVTPRSNNNFAFPAYFVLSVE
ncbi:MAG: SH3 domain-containing protein [Rhabdochlamydiaceae bacterium]|nr:SH3 domain-containing protein [Rhabdochlamydiaceae bacterium]